MKISLSIIAMFFSFVGANSVTEAQPPATPNTSAPATAPARGGRGGVPATEADIAAMAKLSDLPNYAPGVGDGDYSTGPEYSPAPEQTAREGVPKGKVVQFTMD